MARRGVRNVAPINSKSIQRRIEECHAFGHQWRLGKPLGIDDSHPTIRKPFGMATGMVGIPSECVCCTSVKVRWVTRSGESVNRYDYVAGYTQRTADGDTVLSASEWRHNYVERLFTEFETNTRKARAS